MSLSTTMPPSRRVNPGQELFIMLTLLSGDIELCPGPAMYCGSNPNFHQKLFFQNQASIVGKLQDFNIYFSDNNYDCITITETWLREDIFENDVLSDSTTYCQIQRRTVRFNDVLSDSTTYCQIQKTYTEETGTVQLWQQKQEKPRR